MDMDLENRLVSAEYLPEDDGDNPLRPRTLREYRKHSRDGKFVLTADNRTVEVDENAEVEISVAQFSLKRVRLNQSNFINALTEKLFWGEDVRNIV